jgi:gas vesicle protein
MSSKNVLLGVLGGLAAGALLGILLAPEKGSDTRKYISKKGVDLADALKEKFNDFLETITDQFVVAKEEVKEQTDKT